MTASLSSCWKSPCHHPGWQLQPRLIRKPRRLTQGQRGSSPAPKRSQLHHDASSLRLYLLTLIVTWLRTDSDVLDSQTRLHKALALTLVAITYTWLPLVTLGAVRLQVRRFSAICRFDVRQLNLRQSMFANSKSANITRCHIVEVPGLSPWLSQWSSNYQEPLSFKDFC